MASLPIGADGSVGWKGDSKDDNGNNNNNFSGKCDYKDDDDVEEDDDDGFVNINALLSRTGELKQWVWAPHEEHAWYPAKVCDAHCGILTAQSFDGKTQMIDAKSVAYCMKRDRGYTYHTC